MKILLMNERSELSPEDIEIQIAREQEADNAMDDGFTWEGVKACIGRKNA